MEELEKEIQEQAVSIVATKNSVISVKDDVMPKADTKVGELVKEQEDALLQTEEIGKVARQFGEERITSDLKAEASRIRRKNIETAEKDFSYNFSLCFLTFR